MKYHLKIFSMIIHLNFNDYLLKYFNWHLSDIWLSLLYINYISLKFQCSFQTVYTEDVLVKPYLYRLSSLKWQDKKWIFIADYRCTNNILLDSLYRCILQYGFLFPANFIFMITFRSFSYRPYHRVVRVLSVSPVVGIGTPPPL